MRTRRARYPSIICAAAMLLFASCSSTSTTTPAQVLGDAQGLLASVSATLTEIATVDPKAFQPGQVAAIQASLTAASQSLATLATTTAAATSATTLVQIDTAINGALSVISAILPPASVVYPPLAAAIPVVDAAIALLPTIEAFVNPLISNATASAAAPVHPIIATMTPAQARATLGIATFR
jgi:hypothetical protein